jgi:hypothetical protein
MVKQLSSEIAAVNDLHVPVIRAIASDNPERISKAQDLMRLCDGGEHQHVPSFVAPRELNGRVGSGREVDRVLYGQLPQRELHEGLRSRMLAGENVPAVRLLADLDHEAILGERRNGALRAAQRRLEHVGQLAEANAIAALLEHRRGFRCPAAIED